MNNIEIRKTIKEKRALLSSEQVLSLSKQILNNVLSLDFSVYKNFFIYKSFNNEVETCEIISHFLSQNKVIAHPVIKGDYMIAGVPTNSETTLSKFKTLEPLNFKEMKEVDVCFLPLLAFDKNKNRLGYGKGYYDKFLSTHPCLKIGLAYSFQRDDEIKTNAFDVPLDIIVTENEIIK